MSEDFIDAQRQKEGGDCCGVGVARTDRETHTYTHTKTHTQPNNAGS